MEKSLSVKKDICCLFFVAPPPISTPQKSLPPPTLTDFYVLSRSFLCICTCIIQIGSTIIVIMHLSYITFNILLWTHFHINSFGFTPLKKKKRIHSVLSDCYTIIYLITSFWMEAKPWHNITEGWMPLGAGEGFREEVTFDSQFWRVCWSLWVELPLLMPAVWREVTEDGRRNQGDSADSWRNESKISCPFLPGRTGLDGDSCSWRQGQSLRVWRLRRREHGELPGVWGDKRMCKWLDIWAKEPSVAAEKEREKGKLSLLARNPSYCSGNARLQRPVTCQLLKETRVGRPHFLSREPDCQIAFGLSGWHSSSLA